MRKIFGIGETIYDILFRQGQPVAAVPGGSVFNGLISLGRTGLDCTFITEIGADQVGQNILAFMQENGINTDYVSCYQGKKTAISLAFLDDKGDAHYSFYKDYPNNRLEFEMPSVRENDIVAFGAYFALNPVLKDKVKPFLKYAKEQGAILYYDLNFRDNHKHEVESLRDTFKENFAIADIVRGSHEDFINVYGHDDCHRIYDEISKYCPRFICTRGKDGVLVIDHGKEYNFSSHPIVPVSTIGAGDNFNAGVLYGFYRNNICRENLDNLSKEDWNRLIGYGIEFGSEACMSTSNYVSVNFAEKYKIIR
ncbi:MAG: carbohydrate kinase [Bacteroidaceae bacterium]|nr:carbohydrate kinase [Bacteroidaceae bacterium]